MLALIDTLSASFRKRNVFRVESGKWKTMPSSDAIYQGTTAALFALVKALFHSFVAGCTIEGSRVERVERFRTRIIPIFRRPPDFWVAAEHQKNVFRSEPFHPFAVGYVTDEVKLPRATMLLTNFARSLSDVNAFQRHCLIDSSQKPCALNASKPIRRGKKEELSSSQRICSSLYVSPPLPQP